jgi:ribosomal-protein-alanine N-acetyltransferase
VTEPAGGDVPGPDTDDPCRPDSAPGGEDADAAGAEPAPEPSADAAGAEPAPEPSADAAGADQPVQLVRMRRRHLRAVLRIEGQVYPRPWSLTLYMSELNMRGSRHYVVARSGGRVVGYAGALYAADEAHVTTIAVDPHWHRHHIGTRLLAHQAAAARAHGSRHLTLEVRVSNIAAQQLYGRFGFVAEGIRKNYYAEVHEDAIVMWARDIDTDEYAARLAAIEAALPNPTVDDGTEH